MKKLDFDFIPLGISIILILISLVLISTSNYVLSLKHYIGIGCVVISIYFYFKHRMTYYIVFGLILLAGIFGINPISVGLLVLHIALVSQIVNKLDSNK